jgi:hypothetical protein
VLARITDQTTIIPGHGPLANRARLKTYREMLVAMRDRMRSAVAAGRTVEQVLAAKITEPYAREWPAGHERFVRLLHQEMSRR